MSAKSNKGVKDAFNGIIDQLEEAEVLQKYGKDKIESLNLEDLDGKEKLGMIKSSVVGRERSSNKKNKKKKCCKSQ